MQVLSLIIILVLFAFATDVWCRRHGRYHKSRYDEKIVGGTNDTVENNPHIVFLTLEDADQDEFVFHCGGSIISENYILTAAHCISKGIVKVTIRAGSSEAYSGGDLYTSESIIRHPYFNFQFNDPDVAVIRTTQPIRLDGVKTKAIKLPKQDSDVKSGTNLKVSGWGNTKAYIHLNKIKYGEQIIKQENGSMSPNLKSVIVPALSDDACSQQLGNTLTKCMFCAGVPEGGKGFCQGDSGGPAVVSASARSKFTRKARPAQIGVQVGIVSFLYSCARPGEPGVFTKISCPCVRSWIKLTTGV